MVIIALFVIDKNWKYVQKQKTEDMYNLNYINYISTALYISGILKKNLLHWKILGQVRKLDFQIRICSGFMSEIPNAKF